MRDQRPSPARTTEPRHAPAAAPPTPAKGDGPGWILYGERHYPPPPVPEPSERERRAIRSELGRWLDRHDPYEWHHKVGELDDRGLPWHELELWRLIIERQPEHGHNYLHLLDAWRRVRRPQQALEAGAVAHEAMPECPETQQALVELLIELGRDWRQFEWIERPRVRQLDEETTQWVLGRLREQGSVDSLELLWELMSGALCLFDARELEAFLEADDRFEIFRYDAVSSLVCLPDGEAELSPEPCD